MDPDTERELNLMWKHGVEEVRKDMREWRNEMKAEIGDLKKTLTEGKRLVVTLLASSVPLWIAALVSWLSLRK